MNLCVFECMCACRACMTCQCVLMYATVSLYDCVFLSKQCVCACVRACVGVADTSNITIPSYQNKMQ